MRFQYTNPFLRDGEQLPQHIRKQLERKLRLLSKNPRHPSLRIKKVKGEVRGYRDIFEGSITMNYRFIFRILPNDVYEFLHCGTHTEIFGR